MTKSPLSVLFVDDEAVILQAAETFFSSAGHKIITYSSPQALIDEQSSSGFAEFDCAVIDIEMPELSGTELYQKIAEKRDRLPVIFISGYNFTEPLTMTTDTPYKFIPKPFQFSDLVKEVQIIAESGSEVS